MTGPRQRIRQGFTLVEVLIVVVILSIIAAIVVPKAINALSSGKEGALVDALRAIRGQVELYRLQHGGNGPHLDEAGVVQIGEIIRRMTECTDADGKLNASGAYGPYLAEWPANPFCGESVARLIQVGTRAAPPRRGTYGWYYNRDTCLVCANSTTGGESMDP